MSDPSYGPHMALNGFFAPWPPEERIGGWLVRGHNKDGIYEEYVVVGEWDSWGPEGWIDWYRVPIEIGSALLVEQDGARRHP
jgi:hypothetical protein